MGRRSYTMGDTYDGYVDNPYRVPHFVVTHHIPDKLPKGETKFIFVTDGIESTVKQAKDAAGEKDVIVGGGASIAQQLLSAGLLDEIQLHLVPVILGQGIRLFDDLNVAPIELESTNVIETSGVTHLTYFMVK